VHDHKPLSMPKFAGELKALGYDEWKRCGVIAIETRAKIPRPCAVNSD
jgi:hypothetical protein